MLNFGEKLEFLLNILAVRAFMDAKLKVQWFLFPKFTQQIYAYISQLKIVTESLK